MSGNSSKSQSLSRHKGFWILLCAAVFLETIAVIQYVYTRSVIHNNAVSLAKNELRKAELEINVITSQIEMAVRDMTLLAEQNLHEPDSMQSITRLMVTRVPNMVGAAIAFKENFYPKYGKWYEPYSVEQVIGEKSQIFTSLIGNSSHDYFQLEWYQNGIAKDSCWWCEPYFDEAGAHQMIISCSYPIKDASGEVVGVALADVSLEQLKRVSQYLQVFPDSYYSISSSTGVEIVPQPDTIPGRKYHVFNEEIDATGWQMSIIIPDDVMFRDLKRVGFVITLLMIIGLALLAFIMFRTANDLRRLIKANERQQKINNDLSIARNIQMAMLPTTFPPYQECKTLEMYGLVVPAKEVGGDLYDFYVRQNKLFFCIGDVSGKGIPASIVMAVVRSLFRSVSMHEIRPANIIIEMNDSLSESNDQNMFVTLFVGVLDLATGVLDFCNAGHNAPVIYRQLDEPILLKTLPNLPVGILSGYTFTPQSTTLSNGDLLFLYTDGLTEAEDVEKNLLGEGKMLASLSKIGHDATARRQVEAMLDAVHKFVGKAEQSDDLTMLALKYMPDRQDALQTGNDHSLHHSIVMRNDIQQIPTLAEWVDSLNIPASLNMTINLALEEAVSNVMLYAYPQDNAGTVLIEAERTDKGIEFVISDSGIPFDPTGRKEADITLSAEEREIGGLGIHLVRQIMDSIEYERKDNMNVLTLKKNFDV